MNYEFFFGGRSWLVPRIDGWTETCDMSARYEEFNIDNLVLV